MPTINDIAKKAGVAKSTVSRFLNGGSVGKSTKEKLKKIIEETGYRPNVFAKSLKAKKTGLVGVVIPRLDSSATHSILKSLDLVARECGQSIIIVNTNQKMERELEAIETLSRQKVDYIVLIATLLNEQHYTLIDRITTPVIILGQKGKNILSICYDDYAAGQLIAEHIVSLEHEHVLYVGVSESDEAVGTMRKKGVLDFLIEKGVTVDVVTTSFHLLDAYELGLKILPTLKATYIVAATDNIAIGLLKAAYQCGLHVPNDFSLSGFGGYDGSIAVHPSITSVMFPYEEAGRQVLLRLNHFDDKELDDLVLPVKLLVRESTAKYIKK